MDTTDNTVPNTHSSAGTCSHGTSLGLHCPQCVPTSKQSVDLESAISVLKHPNGSLGGGYNDSSILRREQALAILAALSAHETQPAAPNLESRLRRASQVPTDIASQAADEIERLRNALAQSVEMVRVLLQPVETTGGVDAFTWELAKTQLSRLVGLEEERVRLREAAIRACSEMGCYCTGDHETTPPEMRSALCKLGDLVSSSVEPSQPQIDMTQEPRKIEGTRQALRRMERIKVCPKCEQDPYDGHDMCSGPAVKASGKHDSSCVYYYGKPCDCGAVNGTRDE